MVNKQLTTFQTIVYNMNQDGMDQNEIALRLGRSQPTISRTLLAIEEKGYKIDRFFSLRKSIPDEYLQKYGN